MRWTNTKHFVFVVHGREMRETRAFYRTTLGFPAHARVRFNRLWYPPAFGAPQRNRRVSRVYVGHGVKRRAARLPARRLPRRGGVRAPAIRVKTRVPPRKQRPDDKFRAVLSDSVSADWNRATHRRTRASENFVGASSIEIIEVRWLRPGNGGIQDTFPGHGAAAPDEIESFLSSAGAHGRGVRRFRYGKTPANPINRTCDYFYSPPFYVRKFRRIYTAREMSIYIYLGLSRRSRRRRRFGWSATIWLNMWTTRNGQEKPANTLPSVRPPLPLAILGGTTSALSPPMDTLQKHIFNFYSISFVTSHMITIRKK